MIKNSEAIHGGDIYSEGLFKGIRLTDFSSNINPLGVPYSFKKNINEAVLALDKYPDIKYRDLKRNLISYLNLSFLEEHNVVLGNGAAEIIDLVISCFSSILIVVPCFVEYELNAQKWGCNIEYSYLNENMELDYEDIRAKLTYCDAVIMGNPNNPNGGVIQKHKFKDILQYAQSSNKTIILDEAFIEFTGKEDFSFNEDIKTYKSLFIIKALTKFFAVPGIRFGYGISSNKELLTKIRQKQNPWNINCFAEVAVKYVLKDTEYINKSIEWIRKEIRYLPEELSKLNYVDRVFNTNCNYVLCKLKDISSSQLYKHCLEKGIIIRQAYNFRGLDENYVRFAIKDRCNNDLLLSILKKVEV